METQRTRKLHRPNQRWASSEDRRPHDRLAEDKGSAVTIGLIKGDVLALSQGREGFMAKWGIQSDEDLMDIVRLLHTLMRSEFRRLRPKWSQQFGEKP